MFFKGYKKLNNLKNNKNNKKIFIFKKIFNNILIIIFFYFGRNLYIKSLKGCNGDEFKCIII